MLTKVNFETFRLYISWKQSESEKSGMVPKDTDFNKF